MKLSRLSFSLAIAIILFVSCESFLDIDTPRNQLVTGSVFLDNTLAEGAVAGIYQEMFSARATHFASGGENSVTALLGIAADDLVSNVSNSVTDAFSANDWLTDNTAVYNLWASAYKSIFRANEVLEGLAASSSVSRSVADRLRGEALFVRAFCHFYLVNLYGPVPLATTADYRVTSLLHRSPEVEVYAQISNDLTEAAGLLPDGYDHAGGERIRPNKWAAAALCARVALYRGEWQEAAKLASDVIAQTGDYAVLDNPDAVFLKNSREAIWQLLPVNAATANTHEGLFAIPTPGQQTAPRYSPGEALLAGFVAGDARQTSWLASYTVPTTGETFAYPFKYKVRSTASGSEIEEYSTILRLAEQYLIRAEARAELGDLDGALADVNVPLVRHGGLAPLAGLDKAGVMAAIERERLVEFFYEWGHRWFDLKRWGRHGKLLPIPQREREANPFLTQNDGY